MNIKELKTRAAELQGNRIDIQVAQKAVSIDEDAKTATFVMSNGTIDRHGDIIDQESWILDHFMKNPAFFWGHRSNDFPLGKWLADSVKLEADPDNPGAKRLIGTAEFAVDVDAEIKRAWDHVVRGDLNMVSVGFIPHRVEYDEKKEALTLYDCELMECSLVGIGSNRDAMIKNDETIRQRLIDTKKDIEETVDDRNPEANRRKAAILHLNKAIRAFKK